MENQFVYCSSCSTRNFATDSKCGICGKTLLGAKTNQSKQSNNNNDFNPNIRHVRGFIVLIILCFGIYWNCFDDHKKGSNSETFNTETTDLKTIACILSQEFVKQELTSPQSADFPLCSENYVNELGGNEFGVSSYVDAVNQFNAPIRQRYVCRLQYISGEPERIANWRLIEVRFE